MHLIDFLRKKVPGLADDSCGYERATGRALRADGGNGLVARLSFGPDMQVAQ